MCHDASISTCKGPTALRMPHVGTVRIVRTGPAGNHVRCVWARSVQHLQPAHGGSCSIAQAKPVNERLRALGGTAKLALDILEYDDKLERAFTFICGWVTGLAMRQC